MLLLRNVPSFLPTLSRRLGVQRYEPFFNSQYPTKTYFLHKYPYTLTVSDLQNSPHLKMQQVLLIVLLKSYLLSIYSYYTAWKVVLLSLHADDLHLYSTIERLIGSGDWRIWSHSSDLDAI